MNEDEDCDELPMITVNSSASDSSIFAMPSAEELASQRARELACEEELVRLRERAEADERDAAVLAPPGLAYSDSSGSESEAALAAAVTALSVQAHAAPHEPPAAQLWAALAPQLPPPALALLEHLQGAPAPAVAAHLDDVVESIGAALAADAGPWPDEELLSAGALLAVAVLAQESRSHRSAARTLHALTAGCATAVQVLELARVLVSSFPSARIRLQLSDTLRSGGDEGSDNLAAVITSVAILDLLDPPAKEVEIASVSRIADAAMGWRRLDEDARYCCVQLAGRLLAARAGEDDARARLLAAMAPPAAAADALRPDRLKVRVRAASGPPAGSPGRGGRRAGAPAGRHGAARRRRRRAKARQAQGKSACS